MFVRALVVMGVMFGSLTCQAAIVCQKKSGVLVVRDTACKKKETQANTAALGLQGPPGPSDAPAGGALSGTYPNPQLAPSEAVHTVGAAGEPAYEEGWHPYGATSIFPDLGFYKDPFGVVHLTGLACRRVGGCDDSVAAAGEFSVFILPAEDRPVFRELFTVWSNGLGRYFPAQVYVDPGGVVSLVSPPNAGLSWISFSGITFRAAH